MSKVNFNNPNEVLEFSKQRFEKEFLSFMKFLDTKVSKNPTSIYELMEVAYRIKDSVIRNSNYLLYETKNGREVINEVENDILAYNLQYALCKVAFDRMSKGYPLVLQANYGYGPDKDFVDVVKIGLDRFPDSDMYPSSREGKPCTNHYGVEDKDLRIWSEGGFKIDNRKKINTDQKIYFDQDGIFSQEDYKKQGKDINYYGYVLKQNSQNEN